MNYLEIENVIGREIIDSRGNPTVEAEVWLADGTIAGSVLCLNHGLSIFRENTGASISAVVETATRTPAEELGVYDRLGSLTVGKYADIAIFDEQFRIHRTVIGGRDCF